jgi:hypothetical protein
VTFFPSRRPGRVENVLATFALGLSIVCLVGCSRMVSLPEVDLDDPAWTIWEGQALWTPRSDLAALAGDLIVARNPDGDVLVSFSKSPFPIFTARTAGNKWRIDFIDRGRSYYGIGRPPRKFIWFVLPDLLEGAFPPKHWEVEEKVDDEWWLANRKTGETIRLVLDR